MGLDCFLASSCADSQDIIWVPDFFSFGVFGCGDKVDHVRKQYPADDNGDEAL